MIGGSGYTAGFYGLKGTTAVFVGLLPTETEKCRIAGRVMWIIGMVVVSLGVGLPDFDQRIIERNSVAIENAAAQADTLARDSGTGDAADRTRHGKT